MNGASDNGWSGPTRGTPKRGRPLMDNRLRKVHPMRTRFSPEDVDAIGQALAILGIKYSTWSRDTLVAEAQRVIHAHHKQNGQ